MGERVWQGFGDGCGTTVAVDVDVNVAVGIDVDVPLYTMVGVIEGVAVWLVGEGAVVGNVSETSTVGEMTCGGVIELVSVVGGNVVSVEEV